MTERTSAPPVVFATIDGDTLELSVAADAATGLIDFTTTSHDEDGNARVTLIQMDTSHVDGIIETLQSMKAVADRV